METLEYYFLPKEEDEKKPQRRWNDGYRKFVFNQMRKAGAKPHLEHLEELRLIKKAREGCQISSRKLFEAFSVYAAKLADRAARQSGNPELADDMFSLAMEKLHITIQKFDFDRNARLSTAFAANTVGDLQTLGLKLAKPLARGNGSDERKAIFQKPKLLKKFYHIKKRPYGGTPEDLRALSEISGIPPKALKRGLEDSHIQIIPMGRVEIVSPQEEPERKLDVQNMNVILTDSLDELKDSISPRNWSIFQELSQEEPPSKVVVAKKHNISPERAGQIVQSCKKFLRSNLANKGYHALSDMA